MPSVPANCLYCGVCCYSKSRTYVRVSGDDWSRLGDRAEEVAHFIGQRAYLRMEDGHCIALDARIAADGRRLEYFCTIYDRRPDVCRRLDRGSPECRGELETKAQRVADEAAARGFPGHPAVVDPAG